MSEPQKGRPELRILFASVLSMVVILTWAKFFAPKPPVNSAQQNPPAATAPAQEAAQLPVQQPATTSAAPTKGASSKAQQAGAASTALAVKGESAERTIVVENDLYRVEFSNRGGVVKSWQLKKYKDDAKPPKTLDVVHAQACNYLNEWPYGLVLDDAQLQKAANTGLYVATSGAATAGATVAAPGAIEFNWSDGHLEVTKKFRFDHSYEMAAEVSVKADGKPVTAGLAWFGGFGDLTVTNPVPVETVNVVYNEGGKLTQLSYKKLENIDKWGQGVWQGGKDWTGIEDRYFVAAFLPPVGAPAGTLQTRYWNAWHPIQVEGKDAPEAVPQIATTAQSRPVELRVFVGPKDYDNLKKMNPPLHALVNFGWFEIIADPLFHALKWIHKYVSNWGWAIVVLTLVLNMLLFPLKLSSYKAMLKMQRVAPEIKTIQDRYKKYKMNDPRKQEMQKEVMAVYSREGINPVGGCIPQLLQFPIWLGLYRALQGTIEMRHAPWFGWITDLSAKDPYYVLPMLMGGSMWLAMKMTPMTTTDPQQQMMMKIMPIFMAGMFFVIPYPSGLAVYILTSSLVGILQQWYLNRSHAPATAVATASRGKNGKKA